MAAYRCSMCAINYPVQGGHTTCPACEEPTTYFSDLQQDAGWKERVDMLVGAGKDVWVLDMGDEQIIQYEDGQLFVPYVDTYRAGVRHRMPDGQLFSTLAYGERAYYEVLGYHDAGRRYWVREFSMRFPDFVPEEWVTA